MFLSIEYGPALWERIDDRLAIDLHKGQDRAKPNPASPYADTDGF